MTTVEFYRAAQPSIVPVHKEQSPNLWSSLLSKKEQDWIELKQRLNNISISTIGDEFETPQMTTTEMRMKLEEEERPTATIRHEEGNDPAVDDRVRPAKDVQPEETSNDKDEEVQAVRRIDFASASATKAATNETVKMEKTAKEPTRGDLLRPVDHLQKPPTDYKQMLGFLVSTKEKSAMKPASSDSGDSIDEQLNVKPATTTTKTTDDNAQSTSLKQEPMKSEDILSRFFPGPKKAPSESSSDLKLTADVDSDSDFFA
jgi:hypothetical protein